MTEALDRGDYETANELLQLCGERFTDLLRIEADLVYYGKFTRSDVATMKPVERNFHIAEINRRFEEKKAMKHN